MRRFLWIALLATTMTACTATLKLGGDGDSTGGDDQEPTGEVEKAPVASPAAVGPFVDGDASPPPDANVADVDAAADGGPKEYFAVNVYPAVQPTCASCHYAWDGFFGLDAASTYKKFKSNRFDWPDNHFVTKPAHIGPALTEDQKAKVVAWGKFEGLDTGRGF
jgi:hypothetical protein